MSQLSTAALTASDTPGTTAEVLFKHDRPRRIDRVIDYFGGIEAAPPGDPSGEALLEERRSDE